MLEFGNLLPGHFYNFGNISNFVHTQKGKDKSEKLFNRIKVGGWGWMFISIILAKGLDGIKVSSRFKAH